MWKILRVVLSVALLLALVMAVGSVRTFNWVHGLVRNYFGDFLGGDPAVSWLAAVAVFALVCLVPWRSLVFAPVTGRPKPLITLAVAGFAGAGAVKVMNARFPFNPQGQATQCWIETAEGRVVLDLPPGSVDRKTGLVCQALTPEVWRSISLEMKRKEKGEPGLNKYFSPNDGKPIAWFERDSCKTHAVDGYDDYGQKLEPATREKVLACNKLLADVELKRKQQAATQERRERREQQAARRKRFQDIGRYIAEGRFVTLDGYKIVLEECLVLRHETHLKFRMVNIRDEQKAYANSGFAFGLVNGAGVKTRSAVVRLVQGNVGIAGDGSLVPPAIGERGWFIVEFARDSETGTFGILINNTVAFSRPTDHVVSFRGF